MVVLECMRLVSFSSRRSDLEKNIFIGYLVNSDRSSHFIAFSKRSSETVAKLVAESLIA